MPHRALGLSTVGMVAAILLAVFAPRNAFLVLYGTAVAGMFFVWIVILLTHLRFRKAIGEQKASQLPLAVAASSHFYSNGHHRFACDCRKHLLGARHGTDDSHFCISSIPHHIGLLEESA